MTAPAIPRPRPRISPPPTPLTGKPAPQKIKLPPLQPEVKNWRDPQRADQHESTAMPRAWSCEELHEMVDYWLGQDEPWDKDTYLQIDAHKQKCPACQAAAEKMKRRTDNDTNK